MKQGLLLLWILFVLLAKLLFPPEAETQEAWSDFLGADEASVEALVRSSLTWRS